MSARYEHSTIRFLRHGDRWSGSMRIGITYDLREGYTRKGFNEEETAEFDEIETIEAIEHSLRSLGHSTDLIGDVQGLVHRLVQGDRWDLVFNIAEGFHGFGREALVPALLEAYQMPYTFSDPLTLSVTLHKPTAKHVVRDLGIPTSDFEVIKAVADIENVALPLPLFIKPVAEGTSKGISASSKVCEWSELRSGCERLLAQYRQPVLVEAFLPGREFTVGILGTGDASNVLDVMEPLLQEEAEPEFLSYANKKYSDRWVRCSPVSGEVRAEAAEMALDIWIRLGCRDGGRVDLRCDAKGRLNFLEVNPLPGLHPAISFLVILGRMKGIRYIDLIERIVASASRRAPARRPGDGEVPRGAG
jgi:D-alanine-D-alanine ligase